MDKTSYVDGVQKCIVQMQQMQPKIKHNHIIYSPASLQFHHPDDSFLAKPRINHQLKKPSETTKQENLTKEQNKARTWMSQHATQKASFACSPSYGSVHHNILFFVIYSDDKSYTNLPSNRNQIHCVEVCNIELKRW